VLVKGDRVQVVKGSNFLNVRDAANGNAIGQQLELALGTVTGSPQSSGGLNWVYVDYDSGVDGWSTDRFLAKAGAATQTPVSATPTPAPIPATPPTGTYTLSVTPTSVNAGASVTATWAAPSGSSAKDWVGLFKAGDSNNSFMAGKWVYAGGLPSGTFTVMAPNTGGSYEFRYLLNDGYTDVARSSAITVAASTTPQPAPSAPIQAPTPIVTSNRPPAPAPVTGGKTYYVSSGQVCANINCSSFVAGPVAAGSDSDPGTREQPWLTPLGALANIRAICGYSCPDVRLIFRQGVYDTVNGLHAGQDLAIPSGTSFNAPFTMTAYPGNCTPATMPLPGGTYGASTCEPVWFVRGLNPGATQYTIAQMQSASCGGQDCVGAPTQAECGAIHKDLAAGYPDKCFNGSPTGYGTYDGGYWLLHDRSGQVVYEAVIEGYNINYDTGHVLRYLVLDGINLDARGIIANNIRSTVMNDHRHIISHIKVMNSEWKNSAASNSASPGISGTWEIDETGKPHNGDWQFTNVRMHHIGIPFNTYEFNGVNARAIPNQSKYFHSFYVHFGGVTCDWCEADHNAGAGFSPDFGNNRLAYSYIHDNACLGIQIGGGINNEVYNNLVLNNGCNAMQVAGTHVFNNTFVAGPYGATTYAFQLYNGLFENNIVDGFSFGFASYGTVSSDPAIIKNNLIRLTDIVFSYGGREYVNVGVPSIPKDNIIGQDPKFINPAANDYRLQAGSPAINAGFANGLTTDILGNSRVGNPDIGAHEYPN
jgi:hypothetical protein